jgi:transposase
MPHIGIDLGKTSSQVCILTEDGELIERRITTTRSSLTRLFGEHQASRILIEASTESEWVAQHLEGLGHQVVVANPNFAPMYATRSKRVKTDKRDARALAEACRLGAYRQAHRTSEEQRRRRQMLTVREALVRTRARYISLIKALVRQTGERLNSRDAQRMVEKVSALPLPEHLHAAIAPLLVVMQEVTEQITTLDAELKALVTEDPLVKRLCSVPGVGAVTAVSFIAVVDEVGRFSSAKQVRSYLGLVPSEYSSGERQQRGKLTKAGNARLRYLLVEAAWALLRWKKEGTEELRHWAGGIAARRGKRVAAVAVARKLAGILYAIWRDGTEFDSSGVRRGRASSQAIAA